LASHLSQTARITGYGRRNRHESRQMIEELSKKLPLASAILLVLSVVYDYFYLQALALSFTEIATTISDHIRSAIVWLPGLALASGIGYFLGVSHPASGGTDGLPQSNKYLDLWVFGFLAPASFLISLLVEWQSTALAIATFVSLAVFRFQPGRTNIEAKLGGGSARLLLIVPGVVALVSGAGWREGNSLLTDRVAPVTIELRSIAGSKTVQATGLRRFEHVAILVMIDRKVEVVASNDVLIARHIVARRKGALCVMLSIHCQDRNSGSDSN
jgi:hypothetical protein